MKLLGRKRKRPLLVAVLGSGPAALFAAQAVYDTGNVVHIYSRGERSELYGAQYLHQPIPGLDCGVGEEISYTLKGTVEQYRRKVYGESAFAPVQVSPEVLPLHHKAWDIRTAYGHAWERFSPLIRKTEINPMWLDTQGRMTMADLVVWTIPLQPHCVKGHGFAEQLVWAQGDAPDLGRSCSVRVPSWSVELNAEESPRWYRASNIYGYCTAEWPGGVRPPVKGVALVRKPVATACDCWTDLGGSKVLRVGRYGTWTKGELSHEAYFKTRSRLESM